MPSRHIVKTYIENGYYHIYNRGVEKRLIFQDREDYTKFLYLLKIYLTNPEILRNEYPLLRINIVDKNLFEEIDLLAFCLMPNHFHLLVYQKQKDSITKLLRQICTAYVIYFNKKFERVGPLFQSKFKAVVVDSDEYLLHLSRYIHLNPTGRGAPLDEFEWSSYLYYLGKRQSNWLKTNKIVEYFNKSKTGFSYKSFVEDYQDEGDLSSDLTLESLE